MARDMTREIVAYLAPYPGTSPYTAEEKVELVQYLRDEYLPNAYYKLDNSKYLGMFITDIPENTRAIYRSWDVREDGKHLFAALHLAPSMSCVWSHTIEKKGKARITDDEILGVYEEMMSKMVAYEGPCVYGKARVFKDKLCHECFLHKIPEMRKAAANSRKRQRE